MTAIRVARLLQGSPRPALMLALAFFISLCAGCTREQAEQAAAPGKLVIQNAGSDTMVNVAQAWAEEYATVEPAVSVEVSGGGSGTGIAALIEGTVDVANSSRKIEAEELAKASASAYGAPEELVVGFDALAVYVNKSSPLEEITLTQLAGIYGESGHIGRWSQLLRGERFCPKDEIIRVSRQSNSGTYHYFREAILGKTGDFRLGSIDLHGSKDVVELVGRTACAIGYSGMGYATDQVKMLKVARQESEPAYAPTIENTLNQTYPIARPLYLYIRGKPAEQTRNYIQWLLSDPGQRILEQTGYVPLPKQPR